MDKSYILIVDDDSTTLRVLQHSLRSLPVPIQQAKSGTEALEHILTGNVLVAIFDNNMPGPSGLETIGTIRSTKTGQSLPCIMLTGQDQTGLRKEAEKLNIEHYLTKPFSPSILLAAVQKLLGK